MGVTGGLLTHNVFAYCGNNPVIHVDPSGRLFMLVAGLVGAVVGAVVGGVVAAATGGDILKGALIGGAAGGLIGLTCGAAASVVATGTAFASTSTVLGGVSIGTASLGGMSTAAGTLGKLIHDSWQAAEQHVRKLIDSVQTTRLRTFDIPGFGKRVADAFNPTLKRIVEVKYGYQGASRSILRQIAKDAWLVKQGYTVEWWFYQSQVSGTAGYSDPLLRALENAGIIVERLW